MSKGICLFAQKNEKSDYYKQAVACAMSIKAFNPKEQICLMNQLNFEPLVIETRVDQATRRLVPFAKA